jgi:hypothetical protein
VEVPHHLAAAFRALAVRRVDAAQRCRPAVKAVCPVQNQAARGRQVQHLAPSLAPAWD